MQKLTQLFLDAFKKEWSSVPSEFIEKTYPDNVGWTQFMLGKKYADDKPSSFIHRVFQNIQGAGGYIGSLSKEWYTIDAIFAGGRHNWCKGYYPSNIHCLIEHENGEDIETEMYKLVFWRAPLKVIIFYDYNEADKAMHDKHANWLYNKLVKLNEMLVYINAFWPENPQTEYLFLWASRPIGEVVPVWKYLVMTAQLKTNDISAGIKSLNCPVALAASK